MEKAENMHKQKHNAVRNIYTLRIKRKCYKEKKRWDSRKSILYNNGQELPVITDRHQGTDPKRSKISQQNKYQKNYT